MVDTVIPGLAPKPNGTIFKLGRKGMKQFQLDDGCPVVSLDVVDVEREWSLIVAPIYANRADKDAPFNAEESSAYYGLAIQFATAKLFPPGHPQPNPPLNITESLEFIDKIKQQSEEMAVFFVRRKAGDDSSSPGNMPDSVDEL
jgi:hypothetical protein